MRVYLVDDSLKLIHSLKAVLDDIPGVRICGVAHDVDSAIEGISKTQPDGIILDMRIAGGSGLDVLKAVKKEPLPPTVIVFSNYAQPNYRRICLDHGADYVMSKSEDQEDLIEIIQQLNACTNS